MDIAELPNAMGLSEPEKYADAAVLYMIDESPKSRYEHRETARLEVRQARRGATGQDDDDNDGQAQR